MVRLALDMCSANIDCPADIFTGEEKNKRLLLRKGVSLTEKAITLLKKNNIEFLEFPLPFETVSPPPYTFSEEIETSLFQIVRNTYLGFKENSIDDPYEIRKQIYDLIAEAYKEIQYITKDEKPLSDFEPKRHPRSILHLRTMGIIDEFIFENAKNVGLMSLLIGYDYFDDEKTKLSDIQKLGVAALFANIGMMKIPKRIICKQEPLTEDEKAKIEKHPETSAVFVHSLFHQENFLSAKIVLQHHERSNGNGYPKRLGKESILPQSRLLGALDTFASMIACRPYRTAVNPLQAIRELNQSAKSMFSDKVIKCINYRIAPYPIDTVARFSQDKLIQVMELSNIPIGIDSVRILDDNQNEIPYNSPKTIQAFLPKNEGTELKQIPIVDHIDKIGSIVDTFDLLIQYGYAKQSSL
jgi:HD-GYP domain-containing protein (c-di-GMP phosphodiesterase class II)